MVGGMKLSKFAQEIVLISLEETVYYVAKGDEYLDQMMLVDGNFPTPVLCLQFSSSFEAKLALGDEYNISDWWAVHPEIVARLRDTNCLTETDGSGAIDG